MSSVTIQSSRSPWLTLARVFQVLVICLTIGLFILSIPLNYEQRSVVCQAEPCPPGQLTYASEAALARIGMTIDSLIKLTIGYDILLAAVFTICAVVIFLRKPSDLFTIFVTIMLVTFGVATFTGGIRGVGETYPLVHPITETIAFIGNCSIVAFLFVFPNGTFSRAGQPSSWLDGSCSNFHATTCPTHRSIWRTPALSCTTCYSR